MWRGYLFVLICLAILVISFVRAIQVVSTPEPFQPQRHLQVYNA